LALLVVKIRDGAPLQSEKKIRPAITIDIRPQSGSHQPNGPQA